jgi:SAM-dependent methyltransferase
MTGGTEKLDVVFSYWPNSYTNVIRTYKVTLEKGKRLELDFTKENEAIPDMIKPIFYPTPSQVVDAMCKLGNVGKNDVVFDIGCGDGRMIIASVKKFNAKKGVGVDLNPDLVKLCTENAMKEGVSDKTEFRVGDALKMDNYSEASVVLLYMSEEIMVKMRPFMQKTLKPGSRIVSHRFRMGDWEPDQTITINATGNEGQKEDYTLHLWTIK